VVVQDPNGAPVRADLKDNHDGTYAGSYTPTIPGKYHVEVLLDGQPVKGSPYSPLMELANAGQSWADGPGLVAGRTGKPNHFTIHAVDADGAPAGAGGDPFTVDISGPQAVPAKVTDNGDGTYNVTYTAEAPGDYKIDVGLHGHPIKDSPFRPNIKPSSSADQSYAEGPGLLGAVDNEPAHFTIHSVDKWGNPRTDGGDDFGVKITGPEEIKPQVVDNGDGTYSVTYVPDKIGNYNIEVTLEGAQIKDSPFHVQVKSGTDEKNSNFSRFSFTIQTRDKNGADKNFGGDTFVVQSAGDSSVQVQTRDNGDGTYTAEFGLDKKGTYLFHVSFNGQELACSPLTLSY